MSTKEWIYQPDQGAGLYQEMSFDKYNNNDASIQIRSPADFLIESDSDYSGKVMSLLRVDIDAKRFDEIALKWLKHRGFLHSKCTLDELLEKCDDAQLQALVEERIDQKEIGVDLDEHVKPSENDILTLDKSKDVTELRGMFKSEDIISIEDMRIEFDNIFDVINSDKNNDYQ
jgi:hypothetical protein